MRIYKKLLFLSVLATLPLYAQTSGEVDRKVLHYPDFQNFRDVGVRIQNDFPADSLRVRAAFIWVTHHMSYEQQGGTDVAEMRKITYRSEEEKQEAILDLVEMKIAGAFRKKQGVCIDFSLMLNALFEQFGLASKIITGIAKTEIKQLQHIPSYRNHSWNAVQVDGVWRLMDATWASGYMDTDTGEFRKQYSDHYFFTDPMDFARHHLPSNPEWQLLEMPQSAEAFFSAPIYLPEFCEKDILLGVQTSGILTLDPEHENLITFDRLPEEHLMHYTLDDSSEMRRMGLKKDEKDRYTSKIKLRRRFNRPYKKLTLFMNEEPILSFRIQDPSVQQAEVELSRSKKR